MSDNIQDLLYGEREPESVTLPTGTLATVTEMRGHEQRNFVNRTKLNNGTAVQELLGNCTDTLDGESLPEDPKERVNLLLDMLAGDRATLMFAIRRYSLGREFMFSAQCPQCQKRDTWEVDLSDPQSFQVHPYPNGKDKFIEYTSALDTRLKFHVNLLDGHGEMKVLKNRATVDILTDLEVRQPKAWDPDKSKFVPVNLSKTRDSFIAEMRRKLRDAEGYIDTTVKLECKNCSDTVQFNLLEVPDFMIPNATY